MKKALSHEKIDHIHIMINKKICGGNPIIKGTRITVSNIAQYYLLGLSVEEIHKELPHLSLAQIFDASAYYYDHRITIDKQIKQDLEENISKVYPAGKY